MRSSSFFLVFAGRKVDNQVIANIAEFPIPS